jgi:response regulator RpfG family c-di-GMP phosphodiesterase
MGGESLVSMGQILLVDDDETVRRSIQKRLEKEGYRVIAVDNAVDALKIFEAIPFDAVLSDIRMKDMSGIELLGRIRERDGDVPVIMVTGDPSLETAQEAVKRGAYDYITKPVQKEVLLQTVRRAVERRRLSLRLQAYQKELEERVEEQTRTIRALLQMANQLNALGTLQDVLMAVAQGVHRHTRSERVLILLRGGKEEGFSYAYGIGIEEHLVRGCIIPSEDPVLQEAFASEEAIRVRGRTDADCREALLLSLGAPPWLAVGLVYLKRPFGAILASERSASGDYSDEEVRILSYIGDSASVAIHNQMVGRRLQESYLQIIQALAYAVEAKDPYTRGHSERVRGYAMMLARRTGLSEEEALVIGNAAVLHDIGKVEVSAGIIGKPERLTEEEYSAMKDHALLGEIMVEGIPFLEEAKALIRHHHERWDGKGYPDGKKGEEIPIGARIIAIADMYDALTTSRPYRSDTSREKAILQLRKEKGGQLDPRLVEEFISMIQKVG